MRILLVKTSSLGDVVHNLPVVTDLLRHHENALVDWVVEESFADLPALHPGVCRVLPVALRRWRKRLLSAETRREWHSFRDALRAQDYDCVIDTQGLLKSALVARQARGPRHGQDFASAREPLAAWAYDVRHRVPRGVHAVMRNRQLVAAALGYAVEGPPDYGIATAPLRADWLPARRHAVLLTGTSRADKLWADADWVLLGRRLAESGCSAVLPAGSASERERARRIAAQVPGSTLAPPLSVAALAGLIAGAAGTVGLDTGLTHLGAALGRPAIAIFSGSDPALTGLCAATPARNLGRAGAPPTAHEVIAAAMELLA